MKIKTISAVLAIALMASSMRAASTLHHPDFIDAGAMTLANWWKTISPVVYNVKEKGNELLQSIEEATGAPRSLIGGAAIAVSLVPGALTAGTIGPVAAAASGAASILSTLGTYLVWDEATKVAKNALTSGSAQGQSLVKAVENEAAAVGQVVDAALAELPNMDHTALKTAVHEAAGKHHALPSGIPTYSGEFPGL